MNMPSLEKLYYINILKIKFLNLSLNVKVPTESSISTNSLHAEML